MVQFMPDREAITDKVADKKEMAADQAIVRFLEERDIPATFLLMKELAAFEDYADDFRITQAYLKNNGLGPNPLFHTLVVEVNKEVQGYGVFYYVPFTYHGRPKMVLKEFYCSSQARGRGLGSLLFDRLKREAEQQGACLIEWLVLTDNEPAKSFYRRQGGVCDSKWETWYFSC